MKKIVMMMALTSLAAMPGNAEVFPPGCYVRNAGGSQCWFPSDGVATWVNQGSDLANGIYYGAPVAALVSDDLDCRAANQTHEQTIALVLKECEKKIKAIKRLCGSKCKKVK